MVQETRRTGSVYALCSNMGVLGEILGLLGRGRSFNWRDVQK
jgi:hypothetical protein